MRAEVGVFLAVGLGLSVASKWLQFSPRATGHPWLGNALVVPAAVSLTLALLFALPPFASLYDTPTFRPRAWLLAALAAGGVVSFQFLALGLASRSHNSLFFLGPLAACAWALARLWPSAG